MQNTLTMMNTAITRTFFGIFLFLVLVLGITPASAGDAVHGIKAQDFTGTLYLKEVGTGYQGAFFIKSPQLIEIGNTMLKKTGVQYTIKNKQVLKQHQNHVNAETGIDVVDTEVQSETVGSRAAPTTSFSDVNQKVQAQRENATAIATQKNGALFSDVSELLHR